MGRDLKHECNKEADIATLVADVGYIKKGMEKIQKTLEPLSKISTTDIDENTKFREKSKTIVGFVIVISSALGGGVFWLADKVWPGN